MSRRKELTFEKDKIVVGGDIRSLLYAYYNELPVVFSRPNPPFRFDVFSGSGLDLCGLPVEQPCTPRQVWEKLVFLLGLAGLMPVNGLNNNLRVVENTLTATTDFKTIKFNFNKLVIFEDEWIKGLTRVSKEEKRPNRVIDWVNVRGGCRHSFDYLEDTGAQFIEKIYFYSSDRSDNKNLKDLVAISHLTDDQLQDFDYSDTMAKFKIKKMMSEAGIRGARNGRDVNRPGHYKYYAIKLEPSERQIEHNNVRYYEEDERFDFRYDTIEDILSKARWPSGYLGKLCEVI